MPLDQRLAQVVTVRFKKTWVSVVKCDWRKQDVI